MSAERMLEIAQLMRVLLNERFTIANENEAQQAEYDARLLAIAPAEGWPGKNEGERKTAAAKAEQADEILTKMRANLTKHRFSMREIEAGIEMLEAERRALEWGIRAEMVKAIGGRQVPADNGQHETHGAPDGAAEQVGWDAATFEAAKSEELPF